MEFKDFEEALKETIDEFEEIDKFGYIGIMGSFNVERDTDVIFAPNKNIKKGEFMKVLCEFFELLKINVIKQKLGFVAFAHIFFQGEAEYLSKRNTKKDIFMHIISLPDLSPLLKVTKEGMLSSKEYYGKKEKIINIPLTDKDFYYNLLHFSNCLYSRYPKELEIKKIHYVASYIYKNNNKKINLEGKSNKEIYFECCDFLDSISKKI